MTYAYIRVSTTQQNIDRQYEEFKKMSIDDKYIYIDKESGKDFNRKKYQMLIKKLKKNDLLIIKSLDRLGRNYHLILEEWTKITKTIGANIKVLDMPLLDTSTEDNNLVAKLINDLILQVLSFVAEQEKDNIKKIQAEGILLAKQKGIQFGRPKIQISNDINYIMQRYRNKEIKNYEAAELIGVSRSTFFRMLKNNN